MPIENKVYLNVPEMDDSGNADADDESVDLNKNMTDKYEIKERK